MVVKKYALLDSVEVVSWCIPIDCNLFFAFWVLAHKVLFNHFSIETTLQRFFKGICRGHAVRRHSFKSPVTVRTFEDEFS